MKFTTEHVVAGLALLLIGYTIGKRKAEATTRNAVVPSDTQNQADWWTYAGQWRF